MGDVVCEAGRIVPADMRLTFNRVPVNESALTGESVAVLRTKALKPVGHPARRQDKHGVSGYNRYGRARSVVVATGMSTEWAESPKC